MRTIKITNYRCGDYDCVTFMLAPNEWSPAEIELRLKAARDEYLQAAQAAKETAEVGKPPYPYQPSIERFADDMTIAEAKAEHQRMKEEHERWKALDAQSRAQFSAFLKKQGFEHLYALDASFKLDWGHHHGLVLTYEDTEVDTTPKAAEFAGLEVEDEEL